MESCFLNVKSCYSFLDSLLTPQMAVELARQYGCEALALTDPNFHGAVPFFQAAEEAGIHAILGAEVEWQGRRCLAYVRDRAGYENLCAWFSRESGRGASELCPEGLLLFPAQIFPEVRYAQPQEARFYEIVQSIRTLSLVGRSAPGKRQGSFFPRRGEKVPQEALRAMSQIIEQCRFSFEWGGLHFPRFVPPQGGDARQFLWSLAFEGLRRRYGNRAACHEAQLREELGMIAEVGYEEYFLLVWDLLEDCRRQGISWITRGSAADSLVCYCLGISDVCPICFDLYFKRFLNPDRMALSKLPDIDVDFAHDEREWVVRRIFEKHGEHAAAVGGFSKFQGRSAFAEIAKALGVAERTIRRFTERIPHTSARHLQEAIADSRECSELEFEDEPYASALKLAARLDGFPRYAKMHPCGIVLSQQPVVQRCPVFRSASGLPTTHFDMEAVEAIGLVKMDILAQGGLAVLRDAVAEISSRESIAHHFPSTAGPFDDPAVWRMMATGNARGVHHIESPAMTSLLQMVNVKRIEDLIAIVSVIRPGAANTLRKVSFARRAQGLEPVDTTHPCLNKILGPTYGVVAYEEHVLQICEEFAGMRAGRADLLRRALVKNQLDKALALREEFQACARAHGRTEDEIARVWELLLGFRGYAFCKAHSTAYGVEAYQAAWLKTYYPAEFLAAVLTHGKGYYDRLLYTIECRRLGIQFLPPDLHQNLRRYAVEQTSPGHKAIRVPLAQVLGLSEDSLARIEKARPFSSLEDFFDRVRPEWPELDALLRVGALDTFGTRRLELLWRSRRLARYGPQLTPLLAEKPTQLTLPPDPPNSRLLQLRDEMKLLGFTVSGHPLELFPDIAWDTYCPIAKAMQYPGQQITLAGMIVAERSHHQADGRPMKFLTLCDPSGLIEGELFAQSYARFGIQTLRHPVLEARARVQLFDNALGCTLEILSLRAPRLKKSRKV